MSPAVQLLTDAARRARCRSPAGGLNPKNLLLAAAGAAAIAQTGIAGSQQAIAYTVFAVIATIGVGAPVVIYFAWASGPPASWTISRTGWPGTMP